MVEVLAVGHFGAFEQSIADGFEKVSFVIEGLVDGAGEEAGLQAGGAHEGVLGESDAFDGEKLLGVDGLVGGGKILFQVGDRFQVFGANNGEVGSGEAVFAGVLGRAGLAFGGAGAGRASGVSAVGSELLWGCFVMRHVKVPHPTCSMGDGAGRRAALAGDRRERASRKAKFVNRKPADLLRAGVRFFFSVALAAPR
ncbi:MAG: hypothetical protein ACLQU1_09375 [Bryobacteraceae bacterium]